MKLRKIRGYRFILFLFAAAFVVRLAAVFLIHVWLEPDLAYRIIPPDAREDGNAYAIAHAWKEGRYYDGVPAGEFPKFDYYKAAIYYAAGHHETIIPLINSLLGALIVFFVYGIAEAVFNQKAARISAALYAFFPSLVFWSTQGLKDIPSLFIIAAVIWGVLKLHRAFGARHLVIMAAALPLLYGLNQLRCYVFFFLIYAIVFSFLADISKKNCKKNIVYALIFFSVMWIFPYSTYLYKDVTETVQRHNRGGAIGNAAIETKVEFKSFMDVIKYMPIGLTYFLFAPFPWRAEGLLQLSTIPENIIWYVLFMFALYGLYLYRTRWKVFFIILFFTAITTAAYSLYEGNFGTGYRHRATVLPFYFMFAGAGITGFIETRKGKKEYAKGKPGKRQKS